MSCLYCLSRFSALAEYPEYIADEVVSIDVESESTLTDCDAMPAPKIRSPATCKSNNVAALIATACLRSAGSVSSVQETTKSSVGAFVTLSVKPEFPRAETLTLV